MSQHGQMAVELDQGRRYEQKEDVVNWTAKVFKTLNSNSSAATSAEDFGDVQEINGIPVGIGDLTSDFHGDIRAYLEVRIKRLGDIINDFTP